MGVGRAVDCYPAGGEGGWGGGLRPADQQVC